MNVNVYSSPNKAVERRNSGRISECHKSFSGSKISTKQSVSTFKLDLKEKLKQVFKSEFEEMIENILIENTEDFLKKLSEKVRRNLSDNALLENGQENSEFTDSFNENQTKFKNDTYSPIYKFLTNTYENMDSKSKNPNQRSSNSSLCKTIQIISYLHKFKKHCAKTKDAIHSCGDRLIEVYLEYVKDQPKYFLCLTCKKIYSDSSILLFCEECDAEYHSCHINSDNQSEIEIQPATWDKYHCDAIVNEPMRCIKCKELFFLNCLTGSLECKNENCKFTGDPNTIGWRCMFCKEEFISNAKVYNPLEFKNIKNSIKDTLFKKIPAQPEVRPCCANSDNGDKSIKLWPNTDQYFKHKKDCDGNLYLGYLNKNKIVVCEKCKSMNFYEKFIWTCPLCQKRFRHKVDNLQIKSQSNCKTPIRSNSNNFVNCNSNSNLKIDEGASKEKVHNRPPKFELKGMKLNITSEKIQETSPKVKNEGKRERENEIPKYNSDYLKRNYSQGKDEEKERQFTDIKKCLLNEFKSDIPESNKVNITNINLINIINLSNNTDNKNLLNKLRANPDLRDITRKLSFSKGNISVEENPKNKTSFDSDDQNFSTSNSKKTSSKIKKGQNNFNLNLDDFDIIKQIGQGSYGIIYSVQNKLTKEKYAMKKIIAHSEQEVNSFKLEYELMNSITDDPKNKLCRKHVLKIIGTDIKKLDPTTYALYVFSELANTDWEKDINNRNKIRKFYSEDELTQILKITVKTLAEMQRENISHRDIKPQNVLIFNSDGLIYKIADFGEAKELKMNKQQLNTIKGTELYMSPILFFSLKHNMSNSSKISHNPFKSDLYSLGLCMLLASTLIFKSLCEIRELRDTKSIAVIVNKYLKGRYSSRFIGLIMTMLEHNESERFDFIQMEELVSKF